MLPALEIHVHHRRLADGVDVFLLHCLAVEIAGDVVERVLFDGFTVELPDHRHRDLSLAEPLDLDLRAVLFVRPFEHRLQLFLRDLDVRFLLNFRDVGNGNLHLLNPSEEK